MTTGAAVRREMHASSKHEPLQRQAEFRFYEELNDFLPPRRRKRSFAHSFRGQPSVKDAIEALGVPHTEVDLILMDGVSVPFDANLTGGERVAVYPRFERFDISPLSRLRPEPLREPRFILDAHLGKLARGLRMLGFDAAYRNDIADETIIERSLDEDRIILTRDLGILKDGRVTHGYWLRSTDPDSQLEEIVRALDLAERSRPFTRCLVCNSELEPVDKEDVLDRVPADAAERFETFSRCPGCGRVYWRGSHYDAMRQQIESLIDRPQRLPPSCAP